MKRLSMVLTVTLLVVLMTAGSVSATTLPPRWPQPAWFAQFQNAQPTPAPKLEPAPAPAPTPAINPTSLTLAEKTVFAGINRERTLRGLQPLTINYQLVKLARLKSKDMAENRYFAHRSPTYGSAYDMMRNNGIRYSYAGENLAKTSSAANAVKLFMGSSIHRNALLNSRFNQTGIGVYQLGRQVYVTQMFIGVR
ncbi:MAG TPA: CAP domain-containing protein [Oscillospiraceae bacterium]|nr:CAP domain-containing protein [Oscillospiraceae bacterium]